MRDRSVIALTVERALRRFKRRVVEVATGDRQGWRAEYRASSTAARPLAPVDLAHFAQMRYYFKSLPGFWQRRIVATSSGNPEWQHRIVATLAATTVATPPRP